jgi:hypothetical protein
MLSVLLLNVAILRVVMLNIIFLSEVMLSVVMLIVVMLRVVAPNNSSIWEEFSHTRWIKVHNLKMNVFNLKICIVEINGNRELLLKGKAQYR